MLPSSRPNSRLQYRLHRRLHRHLGRVLLASGAAVAGATGCVDTFAGSNLQIDFSPGTLASAANGAAPMPFQADANTQFTLYAVTRVLNETTQTVVSEYVFPVEQFDIQSVINLASPCFIDTGDSAVFPGLHATQFANKMREFKSIPDGRNPPVGADPVDVQQVLTAEQRVTNMQQLPVIKAVTSTSIAVYPAVATACVEDDANVPSTQIPPSTCRGDMSNQRRLALCTAFWTNNPDHYEGTDKVLTAPLGGRLFGMVQGANPINSAPLGGTQFFVDEALADFDRFAVYWQYKDRDQNGTPDYPIGFPVEDQTTLGTLFLAGDTESRTRAVTSAFLTNPYDASINARVAIFANLDEDDVNF